jgi:hypothetical protein
MRITCAAPLLICVLGLAGCADTPPKSLGDGKYSISAPKDSAIDQANRFCAANLKYPLLDEESAHEITFICVFSDDPRFAAKMNGKANGGTSTDSHP